MWKTNCGGKSRSGFQLLPIQIMTLAQMRRWFKWRWQKGWGQVRRVWMYLYLSVDRAGCLNRCNVTWKRQYFFLTLDFFLAQVTGKAYVPLIKIGRLEELRESLGVLDRVSQHSSSLKIQMICRERVQGTKEITVGRHQHREGTQKLGSTIKLKST